MPNVVVKRLGLDGRLPGGPRLLQPPKPQKELGWWWTGLGAFRVEPSGRSVLAGALELGTNLPPQREAVVPLVRGQVVQGTRLTQPGQVRVGLPVYQHSPRETSLQWRVAVEFRGPHRQLGPQPLARLLAPARPLRLAELVPILAEPASSQGRAAGGEVAAGRVEG